MHHHYNDITSRIKEPPLWYDENGVPRYCKFGPDEGANIYARQIALLEIACQACGERFMVAMSWSHTETWLGDPMPSLGDRIQDSSIHYGDPPNADCCGIGASMNCEDLHVVEFWERGVGEQRVPEMEVLLPDFVLMTNGQDTEIRKE
jgi:hypothetical protein